MAYHTQQHITVDAASETSRWVV